jgi:transposase
MCRRTTEAGTIIRRTYGSTEIRAGVLCSIFGWAVGGEKLVHACCWSHARRHFMDALQVNPQETAATRVVAAIDDLFAIDAEARALGLDAMARHELRIELAPASLETIRRRVEKAQDRALPASQLARAAHDTLALWPKLTRFLDYPDLELSNNLAENSMRGVAIGRKNRIHLGSREAGPKLAAILSVLETCRRLGFATREHLAAVLPGLSDVSIHRVAALTPAAWQATRQ